ncbi:MAG: hypothetical protein ABUT39_07935 [Acidobacteriota bacterium]
MRSLNRLSSVLLLIFAAAVPAFGVGLPQKALNEIRLHVLNVGDASCALVECPGLNEVLLFDCGKSGDEEKGAMTPKQIRHYITAVAGKKNVKMVLSHPDNDHVNQVVDLGLSPSVLYLGGGKEDYQKKKELWSWLQKQKSVKVGFAPGSSATKVPDLSCGIADTAILTVNAGDGLYTPSQRVNSDSLVAAVEYKTQSGVFRAVFPGDATAQTLASILLNVKPPLRADVLISPHHGGTRSGENSFLWASAFLPRSVIYSSGSNSPRCVKIVWEGNKINYKKSKAFVYQESLDVQDLHLVPCYTGEPSDPYWFVISARAEYSTFASGIVVLTSGGKKMNFRCLDNDGKIKTC